MPSIKGLNPLTKPALTLTKTPLGSLSSVAKGAAGGVAGVALKGVQAKVGASVGAVAGAATGKLGASAKQLAEDAAQKAKERAEQEAVEQTLKAAGLNPAQAALAEKGTKYMGGINKTKDAIVAFGATVSLFCKEHWMKLLIGLVILMGVYVLYRFLTTRVAVSADTVSGTLANAGKEGFEDSGAAAAGDSLGGGASAKATAGLPGGSLTPEHTAPIPPEEELTFVNAQAKTIKQAGYAGPPTGGKFDPAELTAQALKAGFRAFVLQIDSVKGGMDPVAFPEAGAPTLLYRGDDGTLLSANAGRIEAVTKMIASLAFRPEVPDYTMPVILYLHILAAPSPVRKQEEYIRFLSRVARALNPLAPFHLGSTPMGVFHRQKRERDLLHAPLKSLEGQVIVLSNADTTLFRAPLKGGQRYAPADDLDYWVNMRVSLDNEDETHGIAKVAEKEGGGLGPAAVITSLSSLLGLPAGKRDAFAGRGKGRYVIAMPGAMANPTPAELDRALQDLGVNLVPLDIFSVPLEDSKRLVERYEGVPYKSKPAALRMRG